MPEQTRSTAEETALLTQVQQIQELLEINLFLCSTLDLKQLLGRILEVSQRVLDAEASSVMLLDEAGEELAFEQALGEKAALLAPVRVKLGEGIAGKVARSGEPILLADARQDRAFTGRVDAATGFVTRSVLCVPMKIKERVLGVVELLNKRGDSRTGPGTFTPDDLTRAMAVANLAAVAVENAKLYEEKNRHLEEIQRLEKVKAEFISVISHELRTPLVPIKGYVALLQRGEIKIDSTSRLQFLDEIMKQTDHLARLIEDLFIAIDLEDVSYKLERERVSILEILEHALSLRPVPAETHPVEIRVAPELGKNQALLTVDADKSRLGHAFLHLVDNAVKFSPNGGGITIEIAQAPAPDRLAISVRDHGIGIRADDLPRVFDMFFQVDSSSTRRFGGTGNGLYIAKKIVTAHGGAIRAESLDGEGSTFHMLLP